MNPIATSTGIVISPIVDWTDKGGGVPAADALLQETGDYLLLETGDKLLLES